MKIINTGLFYFGTDGTAYHGKIKLSQSEFTKACQSIKRSKKIDDFTKRLMADDLMRFKYVGNGSWLYSLRVTVTDYIVKMFQNDSRYHYKKQNYIIEVK